MENERTLVSIRIRDDETEVMHVLRIVVNETDHVLSFVNVNEFDNTTTICTRPDGHTIPWIQGMFIEMARWFNVQMVLSTESPYTHREKGTYYPWINVQKGAWLPIG